jgi:hypothetical protein
MWVVQQFAYQVRERLTSKIRIGLLHRDDIARCSRLASTPYTSSISITLRFQLIQYEHVQEDGAVAVGQQMSCP